MDAPEEFVKQHVIGYARLILAFVPASVLLLAVASGLSAALYIRKDVSVGLPYEPIIFAIISAIALALLQLLLVVVRKLLKKMESVIPVSSTTLRALCVVSFLLGVLLGYQV